MKTIRVYGVGRMGAIIAHAFCELGHNVQIVDNNPINIKFAQLHDTLEVKDIHDDLKGVDLVFSAMPYHQNIKIATKAILAGVKYADLGGHIETSESINELAIIHGANVMTDIGLAPGLVNILAESYYKTASYNKAPVHTVNMYCGGMPQKDNPVHYARTWSMDGLLNEYMDISKYLLAGQIRETAGMSLLQDFYIDGALSDKFEAFITSGAAHTTLKSMRDKGVKNCVYKTVRHRGHAKLFFHLYSAIVSEISYKPNQQGLIAKIFPETDKDMVYVKVEALSDHSASGQLMAYAKDGLTAMQRMTAYPAAAVAHLMLSHTINSYADVPYKEFRKVANSLLGENLIPE